MPSRAPQASGHVAERRRLHRAGFLLRDCNLALAVSKYIVRQRHGRSGGKAENQRPRPAPPRARALCGPCRKNKKAQRKFHLWAKFSVPAGTPPATENQGLSQPFPADESAQWLRYVFLAMASTQTISPRRNWMVMEPGHLRVFMKSESATNSSLGICNFV